MERGDGGLGNVRIPSPEQDLLQDLQGVLAGVQGVLREPPQPGQDGRRLTERQRVVLRTFFQQIPVLLTGMERYLFRPCNSLILARAMVTGSDLHTSSTNTVQQLADMSTFFSREVLPLFSSFLEGIVIHSSVSSQNPKWWIKERSTHWFWQMVMGRWVDDEETDQRWRRTFRMSHARFTVCLETLRPHITRQTTNFRFPHPPEIRLAVCIMKLVSGSENYVLSEQTAIGESTIVDIINQVVPEFNRVYRYQIRFPQGEELSAVIRQFQAISGMPNVAGAIDCTHVQTSKPAVVDPSQWFYKRSMYAVVVQAVCGPDRKFLSIFAGLPATYHDQRVLRVSSLFNKVRTGQILTEDGMALPSMVPFSPYLIGDRGYTPYTWLISPVKAIARRGALTPQEVYFNKRLSRARVRVEHAFGLLKRRFLHMGKKVKMDVEFVPKWIRFACILHNILIDSGELDDDDVDEEIEEERVRSTQDAAARNNNEQERGIDAEPLDAAGVAKRQALVEYMWDRRRNRR